MCVATINSRFDSVLATAIGKSDSAKFICLGYPDGRAIAMCHRTETGKQNSISAIGTSLLALSETFIKEAISGSALYGLVAGSEGCLVTVRVHGAQTDLVLTLGADNSKTLGSALRTALDTAGEIEQMLLGD